MMALQNILSDSTRIVTNTDKNIGPAVSTLEHYVSEMHVHLQDPVTFQKLQDKNAADIISQSFAQRITQLMDHETKVCSQLKEKKPIWVDFLLQTVTQPSIHGPVYGIWKLHKGLPFHTRLILPTTHHVTRFASSSLCEYLEQVKKQLPCIVEGSDKLIHELGQLVLPHTAVLSCKDVKALYPNIPIKPFVAPQPAFPAESKEAHQAEVILSGAVPHGQ
jgi:hypothetical protein